MNSPLSNLVAAVVSYVTERGGYMTKTKLLKLLYLFDVEYYRVHGKTFTGFNWKYFHLGPWTREFDPLLDKLVASGTITEHFVEKPDFDAKFLGSTEPSGLGKTFDDYKDELILRTVLDLWGPSPTSEILDYVYFRTEPMEHGIRDEPLDFSRVLHQLPEIYRRPASKATAGGNQSDAQGIQQKGSRETHFRPVYIHATKVRRRIPSGHGKAGCGKSLMYIDEWFNDDFYKKLPLGYHQQFSFGQLFRTHAYYPHENLELWRPVPDPSEPTKTIASHFQIVAAGQDAFRRNIPLAAPKLETNEEFLVVRAKMRPVVLVMPEIPSFGVDNKGYRGRVQRLSLAKIRNTFEMKDMWNGP
jgi:hypothetical protein